MKQIFETDWLASNPFFYNELTGEVSHNINDVIDFNNLEFHPEGFNNYLDFGYSVFEQTPIKSVKFLRHSTILTVNEDNQINLEYFDDPVEKWVEKTSHEDDVFHLLHTSIHNWEQSVEGEIIVPTSGGYDSRLLNFLVKDKSRIRAFTYGISDKQDQSFETVYAQKLSQILGIQWERIELRNYHQYFDEWDDLFGISTHAHGMYHLEFYHQILSKVKGNNPLLSGIIGDAWAGSVKIPDINSATDVVNLSYTHGMKASSLMSQLSSQKELLEDYYLSHQEKLKLPFYKVVESMRFKIILLSYLMKLPKYFGFQSWSPFLIPEIALSMLTLNSKRRQNRLWQKEFFKKNGLNLEDMNLNHQLNYNNTLNYQAMRNIPVQPLDANLLKEVIKPDYIEWINKYITSKITLWDIFWSFHTIPKVRKIIYSFEQEDRRLKAYYAYLTIKPIENILKKRNHITHNYRY
jgi:hypothetical protein